MRGLYTAPLTTVRNNGKKPRAAVTTSLAHAEDPRGSAHTPWSPPGRPLVARDVILHTELVNSVAMLTDRHGQECRAWAEVGIFP